MQYEFRGRSLQEAVHKSIRHQPSRKADAGEQNSCQQLTRWIDQLASDAGDIENEIKDLIRHLDNLKQSRSDNLTNAAIGAATAAAGALGSAARAARTVQRILRGGRLRWGDLLTAIPYIGGAIVTARSALAAARDARVIRESMRELDRLENLHRAIEGTARELHGQWKQNRCDRFYS